MGWRCGCERIPAMRISMRSVIKCLSVLGAVGSCAEGEDVSFDTTALTRVVDVSVAASSDDAEERASGSVALTSTDLELVTDSVVQIVGIRFPDVTIPRGATITAAYVQFSVDEATSDATSLTIRAQAADTAPTFTTATANIS